MLLRTKRRMALLAATAAVAAPAAAPIAEAQPPQQSGLVNVYIDDTLPRNNVGIGVAANVAANVCGVAVSAAVLAEQVVRNDDGEFTCENLQDGQTVRIVQAQ